MSRCRWVTHERLKYSHQIPVPCESNSELVAIPSRFLRTENNGGGTSHRPAPTGGSISCPVLQNRAETTYGKRKLESLIRSDAILGGRMVLLVWNDSLP